MRSAFTFALAATLGLIAAANAQFPPAAPALRNSLAPVHRSFHPESGDHLYTTTPALPGKAPPRPTAATLSALVAASPPHAILHCVYRI